MQPRRASLSKHRRQLMSLTRGSWISLFAMLMIFIGPLVSQSMPMDQRMSMPVSMSMDTEMSMDMPAHEAPAAEHCQPQSEHHALWEKCGYCSLLFNCPALPGGHTFAVFATPPNHTYPSPSPHLGHARPALFPGARTRAPPLDA
jgi:muconolactone delta-isomerase